MSTPRLVVTPGEPAGIGPDIVIQVAQSAWPMDLCVVADPDLLLARANALNLPLTLLDAETITPHKSGQLKIIPAKLRTACIPGQLDVRNAAYVLETLGLATQLCLDKKAQALVTGPVQKSLINEAGFPFTGHTEFLQAYCHAPEVLMLFVVNEMKVALATVHIPLAKVPQAITQVGLEQKLRLLAKSLQHTFKIANPQIYVAGLNPHAGENGLLGEEEQRIITPAIETLRREGLSVFGPFPADTIFTDKITAKADAILGMYHDQALPVVKFLGFGHAVNVTLGLPIIRTSVDHGTALDVAGTLQADAGSLRAALQVALDLSLSLL